MQAGGDDDQVKSDIHLVTGLVVGSYPCMQWYVYVVLISYSTWFGKGWMSGPVLGEPHLSPNIV